MPEPALLSEEQIRNLATYGMCWVCRAPREPYRHEKVGADGRLEIELGIRCPNGHAGF